MLKIRKGYLYKKWLEIIHMKWSRLSIYVLGKSLLSIYIEERDPGRYCSSYSWDVWGSDEPVASCLLEDLLSFLGCGFLPFLGAVTGDILGYWA